MRARLHLIACALAALAPLVLGTARAEAPAALGAFPGWPESFAGRPLVELPLDEREARFFAGFPGRVGRFSDGRRQLVLRWVGAPSRRVHTAADCYLGRGFDVEPLPPRTDADGARWGRFVARRGAEALLVEELVRDADGRTFDDASAWYWSALLDTTRGPWWSVLAVEPLADERR